MSEQATRHLNPVSEQLRSLLCAIAYGWTPTPFTIGRVESLHYGDIDLSNHDSMLYVEESKFNAVISSFSRDGHRDIPMPLSIQGKLSGTLEGGYQFDGDLVCYLSRGATASRISDFHDALLIRTSVWSIINDSAPSLWFGRIEGVFDSVFSGNLIIEKRKATGPLAGERCHFFLSGAYHYYLIRHGREESAQWQLLIDTQNAGAPDMEKLGRDFLAIQFVLGRQLRLPELLGVASDNRTVAWMRGCDTRKCREETSYPPVPFGRTNDGFADASWPALFFERLSAAWHSGPESYSSYWMALEAYLESMRNHLDSDYMRLQIALEALGFWLHTHKNQEEPIDVKDKERWKKWIKDNESTIRDHAVPGREDALIQKVITAYRRSSGKIVPSAFVDYGLPLTSEMKSELDGRNVVVHQGLMAPKGYNVERDLRRVALVRTMLVGLIAKSVSYGGAINGWQIGNMGYPVEPSAWWTINDNEHRLAQVTYIAEEFIVA